MSDLDPLCDKLLHLDPGIMSLSVSNSNGEILSHSHGSEYEQKYLESAAGLRKKAGLMSAVMMGMEEQVDEIFGETEAVVRIHSKAKIVIISFPSRTRFVSILVKKDTHLNELISKVRLVLKDQ